MLTLAEKQCLTESLKYVFEDFLETDQSLLVDAVLLLSLGAFQAVLDLNDSLTDVGDDAPCGPTPARTDFDAGSEVRCPHCHWTF